jgi:hydantoinase/carbamoylase family amidase
MAHPAADPQRVAARLEQLWQIARGPGGGAERPAFSPAEAQAMRLVAGWAQEQGLTPGLDQHGNLWGLPEASLMGRLVTSGSHVDTVPDGGRYDGALGTVLGLELVRVLNDERPGMAGLLICAAEEAPRFGAGTIGSRLLVGSLSVESLDDLHDVEGVSASTAQREYIQALSDLPVVVAPLERLAGHAEIHVATRRDVRTLGVVERVASPRRFEIVVRGEAGHAGEISMQERHDAAAGAAELILAIEAAARQAPPPTVATVGTVSLWPGAVSVIPSEARLGLDARAVSSDALARLEQEIRRQASAIAARRGLTVSIRLTRAGEPVSMDPGLVSAALQAATAQGIPASRTWSGSGHDAQHLGALAPSLLLFVPLHGGESHTPSESAEMSEILQAGSVAFDVLRAVLSTP